MRITSGIALFFSHIESERIYLATGGYVYYCIPYNDDTKHLVGTMEEAPEFYRLLGGLNMRFGYCKTCWWHKEDICYMHRCYMHDTDYCPDYLNRRKRNKDGKLEDWIKEHNEEINLEN